MISKELKTEDFDLIIDGGSRRWLNAKMKDLAETWGEVVRMNQLADISLAAASKNTVFVFQNQVVNVYQEINVIKKEAI